MYYTHVRTLSFPARLDRSPAPSLREEAHRVIRSAIITGEIVPGEIYSAPSLASALGVSPTPVREALLDLVNENLLEVVRNRGFRVVPLTEYDLDEIYELRILLEVPAIGKVAGRLDASDARELWVMVERIEAAARQGELAAYLGADQEFHVGLARLAGNRRLANLIGRLRDQQRLYGLPQLLDSDSFFKTAFEHRLILETVLAGDREGAESLLRRHLSPTRGLWAGHPASSPSAAAAARQPNEEEEELA